MVVNLLRSLTPYKSAVTHSPVGWTRPQSGLSTIARIATTQTKTPGTKPGVVLTICRIKTGL
jgi:hypothetical protein